MLLVISVKALFLNTLYIGNAGCNHNAGANVHRVNPENARNIRPCRLPTQKDLRFLSCNYSNILIAVAVSSRSFHAPTFADSFICPFFQSKKPLPCPHLSIHRLWVIGNKGNGQHSHILILLQNLHWLFIEDPVLIWDFTSWEILFWNINHSLRRANEDNLS